MLDALLRRLAFLEELVWVLSGRGGGGGGVTGVTGTAPIHSSGGSAPAISITAATDGAAGSMSAADKTKLDGLVAANVTATAPITSTGGPTAVIAINPATDGAAGSLSAADKTKLDALNPAAQVTFADDLAGSSAGHQWVAAISGPGGGPGSVPVQSGTNLAFLGVLPTADTGVLRFSADGQGFNSIVGGMIVQRAFDDSADRPIVWRDIDHDALVFGNQIWPSVYINAFNVFQSTIYNSSNGDNSGGFWHLYSNVAGTVAKFYADDQTYEWHQGGPDEEKDGVIYRMNFANTHDTTLQVIGPDQPTTVLVDNAVNIVTVTLGAWDLTETPYKYASWTLEQTYSKQGGVVTEAVTPPTVSAPRENPVGIAAAVNPQMVVDNVPIGTGTGFNVTVTPWTASQLRWEYFSTIKVLSDPGDD